MNMPGFSAENSLYRTSGHYQIDRHAIHSMTAVMSPFKPAAIDLDNVGEEVIPIEGTPPPWGWGPGGWSGHDHTTGPGVGSGSDPGAGGGIGSGGVGKPNEQPTPKQKRARAKQKCQSNCLNDLITNTRDCVDGKKDKRCTQAAIQRYDRCASMCDLLYG